MAITNGSGVGRVSPTVHTANNHKGNTSLDDDERQKPGQIVGFTIQAMVTANGSTVNPFQLIV